MVGLSGVESSWQSSWVADWLESLLATTALLREVATSLGELALHPPDGALGRARARLDLMEVGLGGTDGLLGGLARANGLDDGGLGGLARTLGLLDGGLGRDLGTAQRQRVLGEVLRELGLGLVACHDAALLALASEIGRLVVVGLLLRMELGESGLELGLGGGGLGLASHGIGLTSHGLIASGLGMVQLALSLIDLGLRTSAISTSTLSTT